MIYPNITDARTRKMLAKLLVRWRRNYNAGLRDRKVYRESGDKVSATMSRVMTDVYGDWIYGFRRALEIVNDSMD